MEVISSQCSISARSTSRSRKKGLSLTSHSKFSSQEKDSRTEETLSTVLPNHGQSQTSIKLESVHHKIGWINTHSRETHHLTSVPKTIADMPKITFRYTNDTGNSFDKVNLFSGQFSATTTTLPSRGRPMNCQQMRKVVISSSVQTKNLSQSKIVPQSTIVEANPNKQLIDSRTIDREIIEEKLIAYLPPIEHKLNEEKFNLIRKSPEKHNIYISNDSIIQKVVTQNEYKPSVMEKSMSPYQLLESTAKKNESKELSSGIKEFSSLQMMSLEKIPEVQEFNMNQAEDDASVSYSNESQGDETEKQISFSNQETNFIDQVSIQVEEPANLNQEPAEKATVSFEQIVLRNKGIKIAEVSNQENRIRYPSNSPSPSKKQKSKKQERILREIENKAPESQQTNSMSGKRNIKRIKQIERRLEEIINICSSNL